MAKGEHKTELLIIAGTLLLYSLNRFTLVFSFLPLGFAGNHLNDLLGGVFILGFTNLILSFSRYQFRIDSWVKALVLSLSCALVWELAAPLFVPWSVGDPLDVIAYVAGGLVYLLIKRCIGFSNRLEDAARPHSRQERT